jgi:NhaA family Na+:H+ antiporter
MAIFFTNWFRARKRIYKGELSNIKEALFPIFGAIGVTNPAGIYFLQLWYTNAPRIRIPMATEHSH